MSKFIRLLEYAVIALMGVVTLSVIAEVAARGLVGTSLIVTDELSRYLMVWTAMLAAVLLVHEDGHVRIALVENLVGPRAGLVLHVISQLVVLAFFAVVVVASVIMMPSIAQQNTVTLGVSIMWFYLALPITLVLMAALTIRNTVRRLRGRDGPADPQEPRL